MRVAVLTVDQRGSTKRGRDRPGPGHPGRRSRLDGVGMLRPFERTAGDEFQGVLDDPAALAPVVERLLREDAWNIGIGIGEVEEPLPASTRAGRGPAYLARARRGDRGQVRALAPPRRRATTPGARRPRDRAVALGRACWPGAPRGGWEVADLVDTGLRVRRGRRAARHHPVGGQPARPGRRHRRGPPGPRAGHRPRLRTCSRRGWAPHEPPRPPPSSSLVLLGAPAVASRRSAGRRYGRAHLAAARRWPLLAAAARARRGRRRARHRRPVG